MSQESVKKLNKTFERILEECPELVFIGDRVLRQKTEPVTLEEGLEIGKKLQDVLLRYRAITGFGRGLAAPQIGLGKSVFVTFVSDQFKTYINPVIGESSSTRNLYRESCLSCGYLSVDVARPESIVIEYTNENGEPETDSADGFLARLLQHEYDHLLGTVNIDRAEYGSVNFATNNPLEEKLRNIE